MTKSFFMTGTGTDIGKTYVTGLVAALATERGCATAVMKPAQTGMTDPLFGDLGEIRGAAPKIMDVPLTLACPYCLEFESSPHLAAELAGIEVDIHKITVAYEKVVKDFQPDVLLLESAGGVYVPLNQNRIMADIPAELGIPAIIVADSRLGTINHTVLTVNELRRRRVEVAGVIVNRVPDDPGLIVQDNIKMIEKLGKTPILALVAENGGLYRHDKLLRLLEGAVL